MRPDRRRPARRDPSPAGRQLRLSGDRALDTLAPTDRAEENGIPSEGQSEGQGRLLIDPERRAGRPMSTEMFAGSAGTPGHRTRALAPDAGLGLVSRCGCGEPLGPPSDLPWWVPEVDDDPRPPVCSVVRWGEAPRQRRFVRLAEGVGWTEFGQRVATEAFPVPTEWSRVGRCRNDTAHPVVAVWELPGGAGWTYDNSLLAEPAP